MIELEVLVEVLDDYDKAVSILSKFEFIKEETIIDEYFYDPLRNNLKPDGSGKTYECLRIRNFNNGVRLTYKQDVYENGIWQYSNENELVIESVLTMKKILESLGLKELVIIDNQRKYYKYGNYEIVLEKVKDLGTFMEVEYKGTLNELDVSSKRKDIESFIKGLGICISSELNAGKPELFIKKHGILFNEKGGTGEECG